MYSRHRAINFKLYRLKLALNGICSTVIVKCQQFQITVAGYIVAEERTRAVCATQNAHRKELCRLNCFDDLKKTQVRTKYNKSYTMR